MVMETKQFTVVFKSLDEVNLVFLALGELPAKQSYNLISEIHEQINKQLKDAGDNGTSP